MPETFTTPSLATATDGVEIVWSSGASTQTATAPDLYSVATSGEAPRLVFQNENRDSNLLPVAVSRHGYAFVEANVRVLGENQWRLWYLPEAGRSASLIDESDTQPDDVPPPLPSIAMTEAALIWTTVHHTNQGFQYRLMAYYFSSNQTDTLASGDPAKIEYWFPSGELNGPRVAFSTVEHINGGDPHFNVYLLDPKRDLKPRYLDTLGPATMPLLSGDVVIWKTVSRNVFNPGSLILSGLGQTADPSRVVELHFRLQDRVNYPSIGNRYLAAWGSDDTDFELFDLDSRTPVTLASADPKGAEGWVRPQIAKDLLIFTRVDGDAPLRLSWIDLR